MSIKWIEKDLPIKELKDYERNPRRIKKEDFERLVKSLKEDGYHQRLIVNKDGTIIGGHQRKKALLKAGFKETDKIKVLLPDRLLQESEFKRINIRDNVINGEWDMDILAADFELDDLMEWGLELDQWLNTDAEVETAEKKESKANKNKCPECGHEF